MEKFSSYLCLTADLDRFITEEDVSAIESSLSKLGFYNFEHHLSVGLKPISRTVKPLMPEDRDTPDTSAYTEQAYPAPAEEPEQPEEPKEEHKEEPAPVPKDVTKDELKAVLREYRDRFGWEALHELYDRFGNGATKLVDLDQGQYAPMYAGAQEKLGDA